ncbi:MAG: NAD(P)H-binding protein [Myxococcales bacterium]|nr:NAD(P)H-binding protein [Myxococcales bacterium]
MSTALITGATTPVGIAIAKQLLADRVFAHILAVGAEPPEEVKALFPTSGVTYLQADLTHPRALRNLLFAPAASHQVTTVIHTALHRAAQLGGQRVHQLNVESTRELLRLCEQHPTIRRFVLRSHAEIYRVRAIEPEILDERHPIDLSAGLPQWLRDRAEADLITCAAMAVSPLQITVLRCAECLIPDAGSQLFDYLCSQVCLQPLGFDPMLNVLSLPDLARAFSLAAASPAHGIFNIVGQDTLPLSALIHKWGRLRIPLPSTLLGPLYWLRSKTQGTDFRYDLNRFRFHFSAIMDGRLAAQQLHYTPQHAAF